MLFCMKHFHVDCVFFGFVFWLRLDYSLPLFVKTDFQAAPHRPRNGFSGCLWERDMDLKQQIRQRPMTGFQWLVVALAVALNMLDGFDVLAVAFTAKSIKSELGLTGGQIGSLMSAGFVGMTAGSLLLGPLADRLGRRPVLMLSVLLSAAGMLLTVWSHSMAWLVASRVLTGLGVGAMVGGMSAVMLQTQYGWRSVFMVGAVLTAMAFVALVALLPESVDYLLNRRPADAKARLDAIAAKMGLHGDWAFPEAKHRARGVSVLRLFQADYLKTTLLIWLAFIAVMAAYYFISSWTPTLLEEAGMSKASSQTVGMAISIGGAAGSLLFGYLVSRWGARTMLLAFAGLAAAAVCAFVPATANLSLALVLAVVLGALSNGCIAGLYTINPALWEADFRSTGVAVAIGVGRIGSMVSPMLVGRLLDAGWQKNQLYFGAAAVLLLAMAAVTGLKQRV